MEPDFEETLSAIWLVFGGTYLNHSNAPRRTSDHREQLLVDLLYSYLQDEVVSLSSSNLYDAHIKGQLDAICNLLMLWSQDLDLIYQIREAKSFTSLVRKHRLVHRFLNRVKALDRCTIIPNGLISAFHKGEEHAESVSLGILKKKNGLIDWVQVDPGSTYHQHCKHVAGERSNAFLVIQEIDPANITEEWLELLVGLKAVHLDHEKAAYRDVSLYEGLLSHLNGKTVFQSQPDEGFIVYSHASPTHTWQVIDHSFRYLLRHFLGDSYPVVDKHILVNFKLFLMRKTLAAFQDDDLEEEHIEQCHYLLQEMCRNVAQEALDKGDEEHKSSAFDLINRAKVAIRLHYRKNLGILRNESRLKEVQVSSLSFVAPRLFNPTHSSSAVATVSLEADPIVILPKERKDIIDYLKRFKCSFIDKLKTAKDMTGTALLSYGIEVFFIEYLANTKILKASTSPFSKDDVYLAKTLKELAEIYYGCQSRFINDFLSNSTYQPEFYAKNVTVQFFVYAAIASLNLRDPNIGPLLKFYKLSVATSGSLTLDKTILQLVIEDSRWVKLVLAVESFFSHHNESSLCTVTLFSAWNFTCEVRNNADETNTEVKFAYQLLQKFPDSLMRFTEQYRKLKDEKLSQKWSTLTFTDTYLPPLFCLLFKVANIAKVSLTGFPASTNCNQIDSAWKITLKKNKKRPPFFFRHRVMFKINNKKVSTECCSSLLSIYSLKSNENEEDPFQNFITCKEKENETKAYFHSLENEIIANQNEKPTSMDSYRYMQLRFLQSEPWIKLERLYIALKENLLDCSNKTEGVLIKQTLFEISLINFDENPCSLLQWTVEDNPALIHEFGLLCIEKALALQYRLSQHHAIGEIILTSLGLLTFYPAEHKDTFIEGIMKIYCLLKEILAKPPSHLSDNTLVHLNAYLLIAAKAKPPVLETDTLILLKALLAIQNYHIDGVKLENRWLLQVRMATFSLSPSIEGQLAKDLTLLNDLMLSVIPKWEQNIFNDWKKNEVGLLFTCGYYAVKPLLGQIYFMNQPFLRIPDKITGHRTYKEYLGEESFPVRPFCRKINSGQDVPCYVSTKREPRLRLTLIKSELLIEEYVTESDYLRYISAQELLGSNNYFRFFFESPHNQKKLFHWLDNNSILIKDAHHNTLYKWDLSNNFLRSLKHKGYVVPWEQLQDSNFKTFLENVESPDWIELIAQPASRSSGISIDSLHLPRLGLHFNYQQGKFFSEQIHGFVIAKQQHLNTLQGFNGYIVLELHAPNSVRNHLKIIVPHRKITPEGPFYTNAATANRDQVLSPAYFVYDYDSKTGLLKGHHIRAHLYLALLYYRTASWDEDSSSHCNAYHLARENLELCWKDQPYDSIELDIIEQLLDVSAVHQQGLHSDLVALYLKVVSLLSSSLRLAFLFTEEIIEQNKKRSSQLLNRCAYETPHFLVIYLQNKSNIFERIRLSPLEEEDAVKHCGLKEADSSISCPEDDGECIKYRISDDGRGAIADYAVYFLLNSRKCYNSHYREFFPKEELISTDFQDYFKEHLSDFSFAYDTEGINFSLGIKGIFKDRFRLIHFISLYNIAKRSDVSIEMFRYLLHHMLVRAKVNYGSVNATFVMTLGRALLLVAENPEAFPNSPDWFNSSEMSVNVAKRQLIKAEVFQNFPAFTWTQKSHLGSYANVIAKEQARKEDKNRNDNIWFHLEKYDLDTEGIPCRLPEHPHNFVLCYESRLGLIEGSKQKIVREHYLQAARNDSMYQFFTSVFRKCDELKHGSKMGWTVASFFTNSISVKLPENEEHVSPSPKPVNLEKWAISQEPLLDVCHFFSVSSTPVDKSKFLYESQLQQQNGYQSQFYSELKKSWFAYIDEVKYSYSWRNTRSLEELKCLLKRGYVQIHNEAEGFWNGISALLQERSNVESSGYFALRWYSGRVRHYHKCDILRLLIEPHKLSSYNPGCLGKSNYIIRELLRYIIREIKSAQIVRVLALIEQYKQSTQEAEQFAVLQILVKNLQEKLDPACVLYPHWLLFQFENDIIIRDNQRELIVAMLGQTEKAMYQLNMGEGKSSVILPLVSFNLANGHQLLRINVPSPLLTTMKEFLRKCFSGLIQKHVYTLPFYRDTDISSDHLKLILETLQIGQNFKHVPLVTPEHRLCLQLKVRELMLENQQQMDATNIFNWETYRKRVHTQNVYQELNEEQLKDLLKVQDEHLRSCLLDENYIDSRNYILKQPSRGQGYKEFARLKEVISSTLVDDSLFREWSCLKAAYRELLYNSTLGYEDSKEKLGLLIKINAVAAIDLLDESDEILKHGTELNYTAGDKHVFAGGELRWQLPQFFIKAMFFDPQLRNIITEGTAGGLTTINLYFSSQGGVPFIQLLNESHYEDQIKPVLITKFLEHNLHTLRKYHCSPDEPLIQGERSSLRDYVAGKLSAKAEKKVMNLLADKGSLKDKCLIAKGWLSHGILFHVFNAKYRVQYGLNLKARKQIAIPFFGKDAPSPRSEFSHPDIMLGFTIISYLYQGLNQQQLKETLNRLKCKFSHKVADAHLREWTQAGRAFIEPLTKEFPPLLLTSLQNIDLADDQCLAQVHRYLSGNCKAIFFYLDQFVFLEEAMQYLYKISANAHSLVGYNAALGFSGTDDRKITMPFEIKSLRSASQEGTNGKLLAVLTQERNSSYFSVQTVDTLNLLQEFCDYAKKQPNCHALIDAGALITGVSNFSVAEFLLHHLPANFLGVLYFSDEGNSLTVLTRDKKVVALQDCYLDKQHIFAYLDDIHTRGTDIQLPLNCHAILTVGLGMEKDKLMQAAMRLRQLAQKQSVSLWGTQAVTLAITRTNSVKEASLNSLEVIKWVTRNTIEHINADLFPVAIRKVNFQFLQKTEFWLKEAPSTLDSLVQHCQEKELFQLEEFYGLSPQREHLADRLHCYVSTRLRLFWQEIQHELEDKQLTGTDLYAKVVDPVDKAAFRKLLLCICDELTPFLQLGYIREALDSDEEKEVEVEVEVVREQDVVLKVDTREEYLENQWHVGLILNKNFVQLAETQGIIVPIYQIRNYIQVPSDLRDIIWHKNIYMTTNFIHSVTCQPNETLDNYLRPVDAVLMHRSADTSTAILLSGQEASWIKMSYYEELSFNLLIHINDIDGPSQLPAGSSVSKQEQKLLTIVKLFSGQCHYTPREVLRISKRLGRIYPRYFMCLGVSTVFSEKLFGILVEEGFLDFSGVITDKLLKILRRIKSDESHSLNLPDEYQSYSQPLLQKLYGIFSKLIVLSSSSLKNNLEILWQWVGTRGRLKEYPGSALESILNVEHELKGSL